MQQLGGLFMEKQQKVIKNNISRVARLKKQKRKRRISLLICGVLVIGIGFFIGYKLYIKNKCKDLGYAVEHYLTSKKADNGLLRVQNMTLVFSDDTTAIVKAYGLSKEEPHEKSAVEGMFRKDSLDSWDLESTTLLNTLS